MSGRHRYRPHDPRARRLLAACVPVIGAAGVTAAVVLGGGALATPAALVPAPVAVPAGAPAWWHIPPYGSPAAAVSGAVVAAQERAERAEQEQAERAAERSRQRESGGTCDLDGPPRFDDPDDPNEITNRECGYVDDRGRSRSRDPWIDDQLLDSYGE